MKNKIIFMLLTIAVVSAFSIHNRLDRHDENSKTEITSVQEEVNTEPVGIKEENNIKENISYEYTPYDELISINNIKNEKEKIIFYRNFINQYIDLDVPETIYDYYSIAELETLFRVVEAEATAGEFIDKANVASVIFNRIGSSEFGNSLDSILINSEFSSILDGRYKKVDITEDTILACEYVFMFGSTVGGATFFDSTNGNSWASMNKEKISVTDNIGHDFFR